MNRLAAVGLLVLVLAGFAAGAWALRGTGVTTWVSDPRKAVKPANLVPVHEAVPELADCNACHALDKAIPREKCLDCHDEIRERRRARKGHHGRNLLGTCHDCHVDHEPELIRFDRASFNHEQAVFPLRGAHATLECEACHEQPTGVAEQPTRMDYIGLAHERCVDCHDDPHRGTLTADTRTCIDCHSPEQWTGRSVRFVHDRDSSFRLDGMHAEVACIGCHVPPEGSTRLADAQMADLGTTCADCHEDPHAAQFEGTACSVCHVTAGFDGPSLAFDHASLPTFRLEGAHATIDCAECHRDGEDLGARRFRGAPRECSGCHEDPHDAQFEATACDTCHRVESFAAEALRFDHRGVAEFPLSGRHVDVPCAKCHEPAEDTATRFRGTSRACATCHDDPHAAQFGDTPCASCHRDSGFTGDDLLFRHDRVEAFPLTGAHATVPCESCHLEPTATESGPRSFRGLGTTCSTCHDDAHAGSVADQECSVCHTTPAWTGAALRFEHDTVFLLDSTHRQRPCSACHESPGFDAPATACAGCHVDVVDAEAGRATIGGDVETFDASPHAGLVTCAKCHDTADASASTSTIAARCASCHNPRYAKLALDRRALLDDLLLRGRRALPTEPDGVGASALRDRIETLHRAAAHDFAPAERRLRALVESLED